MKTMYQLALALCCLALSACGGGGASLASNEGVGTGGTGISQGTVSGFGSIVIDGTTFSSASPGYTIDSDQSAAGNTDATAVQLGAQVRVLPDAQGNPASVRIERDLVGTLVVAGSNYSVNGVSVRINRADASLPPTYMVGLRDTGDLQQGIKIAVSGAIATDAQGSFYVQATLLERLPASDSATRVSGVLSGLAANSFQLGNFTVQYAGAGTSLKNGQWVNVWSNQPLTNGGSTLVAGAVSVHALSANAGPVRLGGVVSSLDPAQGSLLIAGIAIQAPRSLWPANLSTGQYLSVSGSVNAQGAVNASSLSAYASAPIPVHLKGSISSYLGSSQFIVRGVVVDASSAHFSNGSSADLAEGVYVDLQGSVNSALHSVLQASSVSFSQPADGATVSYQGSVGAFNSQSQSFTLHTGSGALPVTLASNVAYGNGSASQLQNGANVQIEATQSASGVQAYSVNFIAAAPSSASNAVLVQGRISNLTASTMTVGNVVIDLNGESPPAPGTAVNVWVTPGAGNLAESIDIRQ